MVLLELDGNKNLAAVSQSLQLKIETVKDIISTLHSHELVEKRVVSVPVLNAEFFDFLKQRLSLAMGPIATFIVEDEMQEFSDGSKEIPLHRAAELVDLLARQIHRNSKRIEFQQAMVTKIKEISS
ncbi:hypothetical protein ACFLZL_02605 [Thermodesulfobacteriota bacterium]